MSRLNCTDILHELMIIIIHRQFFTTVSSKIISLHKVPCIIVSIIHGRNTGSVHVIHGEICLIHEHHCIINEMQYH